MKKLILLVLSTFLICTCCVGGTYAWIFYKTQEISNTFTHGNVDIELSESTGQTYGMIPGTYLKKDPHVTVLKDSEACYLFVEIVETNTAGVLTYEMAEGWTALDGQSGIWWRIQADAAEDVKIPVLLEDRVYVENTVTATTASATLSVVAYAIQQTGINTAAEGWQQILAAGIALNP